MSKKEPVRKREGGNMKKCPRDVKLYLIIKPKAALQFCGISINGMTLTSLLTVTNRSALYIFVLISQNA